VQKIQPIVFWGRRTVIRAPTDTSTTTATVETNSKESWSLPAG
jgi:hypothetical protein